MRGRAGIGVLLAATALLGAAAEGVSAQSRSDRLALSSTHYERFVRERHDAAVHERHLIGELVDEAGRATFAVVHSYEPNRPAGHEAQAFALRVDLSTPPGTEQVFTGWLDPYELEGLARALPQLTPMMQAPGTVDHYVQVDFPRGAVSIGLRAAPGAGGPRLFIQVGKGGSRAFLDLDRFATLQELVAASVAKLHTLQRPSGHRH